MQPVEIFGHDISVRESEDELDGTLFIVDGKDWEGQSFSLWLNEEEAKNLSVQLGYLLYESE